MGTTDYTNAANYDVFAYILSQFPSLNDAGLTGYSFIYPEIPDAESDNPTVAGFKGFFALLDTEDKSSLVDLWEPINKHINATWPGRQAGYCLESYPSFLSWRSGINDADNEAGLDLLVGSWLLDKKALTTDLKELASALRTFTGVLTQWRISLRAKAWLTLSQQAEVMLYCPPGGRLTSMLVIFFV